MAKNLTQGSPAKLIFFFALPLFIGNLFQQIYNMADTPAACCFWSWVLSWA